MWTGCIIIVAYIYVIYIDVLCFIIFRTLVGNR